MRYSWKLIDKNTGELCSEGHHNNLVTDSLMYHTLLGDHSSGAEGVRDNYRARISLGTNVTPIDTMGENILIHGVVHKYMTVGSLSGHITPVIDSSDNYNSFNYHRDNFVSAPSTNYSADFYIVITYYDNFCFNWFIFNAHHDVHARPKYKTDSTT